jgi:alkylation response protein AidB-like acyl-CoA dehydrogenase
MDFTRSEESQSIQELAAQIFADQAGDEALKRFDRHEIAYHAELWKLLAEAGLIGVALAEEHGGSGLGFTELCAVFEEQGRHVAALPLLATVVLGALPIAAFGSEAQRAHWLPAVARGDVLLSGALCCPDAGGHADHLPRASADGAGWRLDGTLDRVPYSLEAAAIMVPACADDGAMHVFLVPADATGLTRERQRGTNHEPVDTLEFTGVKVATTDMLGKPGEGACIAEWIGTRAATALGFMQLGVLSDALRRTAAHTIERKQFGKPLAGFQAVAHRAADAYIDVEALRSTAWQAAWRMSESLPAESAVASLAWWACEAGHRVGHACQHLHGGAGADLDAPIHRYFLWARQIELSLGGSNRILARFGASLSNQTIEIGL